MNGPREIANAVLPAGRQLPEISVVMPTYNQAKFLREALDGILAQTFREFELIVVNDGSTDDTEAIVTSYSDPRIKYFKTANAGPGAALNEGFRYATARYETWWASDNVLAPQALQTLYDFLESHAEVDFVYTDFDIRIMDETGLKCVKTTSISRVLGPEKQKWDYDRLTHYYFLGVVWLWRRELHERAGKFPTTRGEEYLCEDYDFALRAAEAGGRFAFLDANLAWYRQHGESLSATVFRGPDPMKHQRRIIRQTRIRRFPRKAWFYWGDRVLPYLRFLSVYTFCKQNPDWQVTVFRPAQLQLAKNWPTDEQRYELNCRDYSDALTALPVRQVAFDMTTLGLDNDLSEVHKADLIRLHLLGTEGGLWSDMDIVYFAPLNLPWCHDTYVCDGPYGHSVGFLASTPDNPVFQFLLQRARQAFLSGERQYQTAGASLFHKHRNEVALIDGRNTKHFPALDKVLFNIPMDTVYAYDAMDIPAIYRPDNDGASKFTEQSIGCHWYGGHPLAGTACNTITEDNWPTLSSVLGHALKRALA